MRHHSKLHISGREFTKKLRFNNNDYILTSVFDGGEDFDFDKEWELEQRKKIRRRMLRPHADYAFPVFESLFDELSDDLFDDEVVDDDSDYTVVYFNMGIFGTNNTKEVHYSAKSKFINWTFECISDLFAIPQDCEDKINSIDDFIQKTGSHGDQNEYKIKLRDINTDANTGELKFIVENIEENSSKFGDMVFKIYIDNEHRQIEFSLFWDNHIISFTRLKNLTYISTDLLDAILKTNGSENNDIESYKSMFDMLMKSFQKNRLNCTVCKRKTAITKQIDQINKPVAMSVVPKLFSIVGKFGRELTGQLRNVDKIMNWEIQNGNLFRKDATNDSFYVIISGDNNDKFVRAFMNSLYRLDNSEFMYAAYDKKTSEELYTKEKLLCIIMPFSKFMNALTRLNLFTTTGEN